MEDKVLLTKAYQLVSKLNQTIQSCKLGLPDDLRLQQNIDEILRALKKAKSLGQKSNLKYKKRTK